MCRKPSTDCAEVEREAARHGVTTGRKVVPFMDPETMKKYREYLDDWRWRMSTFDALQREYMGRGYRPVAGEKLW